MRELERRRKKWNERLRWTDRERKKCVCVCVCVREREREREPLAH